MSNAYKLRRELEQVRELLAQGERLEDECKLIQDTLLGCSDDVSDAIRHEVRCGAVTSPIATRIKKVLDDFDALNGMFKAFSLDIGKREEVRQRFTADDQVSLIQEEPHQLLQRGGYKELYEIKNIEDKRRRKELPPGYDIEVVKNEWGKDRYYPKWQKSNGEWDYFYVFTTWIDYRNYTLKYDRRKTACHLWRTAKAQITIRRRLLGQE